MAQDAETEQDGTEDGAESKKGGKGLLIGLVGAVVLGGAGFYASYSGLLPLGGGAAKEEPKPAEVLLAAVPPQFVAIEGIMISLGHSANSKHLKFGAQLEVEPQALAEVEALKPRIVDVVNTFLRAVEERDLEAPSAMTKLRAQLLRRVRIIAGEGKIKDLLITEFVFN